ncbi:MAG: hypothetical protein Q8934_03555 [Bacillota bacterium]|nr:hypothetical protein [Bacillota bacterium]
MIHFILNHLFIAFALIILLVIFPFILRFLVKIALILAVLTVAGYIYFGPKFLDHIQDPIASTQKFAESAILPVINSELQNTKSSYNPTTKQYTIQSPLFKLEGVLDQDKADIIVNGNRHTIDVKFLKGFIEKEITQPNNHQIKM